MALYLKELALLETTTNTVVKLTNVMEGIEGAAVFGYNTENVTIQTGPNRTEQIRVRHTLEIRVKDDADSSTQATLTAWANNPELRFKASGYSGDTFFLWDEPVPIVFSRQYDGIGARRLLMTLDAVPGFNNANATYRFKQPVYAGQNLLGIYRVLDGNASILNGFADTSSTGLAGQSVTGANQSITIDVDPSTSYIDSADLFFPFAGVIVTLSAYCVSTTDELTLGIGQFEVDGTLISQDYGSASLSIAGRISQPFTLDSAVGLIRIGFSGGASSTSVFNTPAIRLGYETAFTN